MVPALNSGKHCFKNTYVYWDALLKMGLQVFVAASRLSMALHEDIWLSLVVPRSSNNVYILQNLRAVNRTSRAAVDLHVWQLVDGIQKHVSQSAPANVDFHVLPEELSCVSSARKSASDWLVLICVANNRIRRQDNEEAFIADMRGRLVLFHMAALMFGKLSLGGNHPVGLKPLTRKLHERNWAMREGVEQAIQGRDSFIEMTVEKMRGLLPPHRDEESGVRSLVKILKHAIYNVLDQGRRV